LITQYVHALTGRIMGPGIQVGMTHASQIVTIELGDTNLRVTDQHGELITAVPRNGTGEISRFKAHGRRPCRPAQQQPHTLPRRRRSHDRSDPECH
jgi:hypothetical protein